MKQKEILVRLKKSFPTATDDELAEIDRALTEHIRLALDIWNRITADPTEYERMRALLTKNGRKV